MKIWSMSESHKEGKYLVVRRDGTIPQWPHFVLGGDDPCSPAGLEGYADKAAKLGYDSEYVHSIRMLASKFELRDSSKSDPEAGPHRKDNPHIIQLMRRQGDLTWLGRNPNTLRNQVAAQVLAALVTVSAPPFVYPYDNVNSLVEQAFTLADAMLSKAVDV